MKQIYTLIAFLLLHLAGAQNIDFPANSNFKATLLYASENHPIVSNLAGEWFSPDADGDYEISVQEAANVKGFHFLLFGSDIDDFSGIEYFVNLESIYMPFGVATTIDFTNLTHFRALSAENSALASLDFSHCPDLRMVYCPYSQLTELNLTGVTLLEQLDVSENHLTSLEVHAHSPTGTLGSGLTLMCAGNELTSLVVEGYFDAIECYGNQLTDLDLSHCTGSATCAIFDNPLVNLNLKNGIANFASMGWPVPPPAYICADEGIETESLLEFYFNEGVTTGYELNSYCSVTPGGQYFTIQGSTHADTNANGCDASDPLYPHLNLDITNQFSQTTVHHANGSGNYALWLNAGNYTIVPHIENPGYFNVSPSNVTVTVGMQPDPIVQDFCLTPNGSHPDVAVSLVPVRQARPGFDAYYNLTYRNVGTVTTAGTVSLFFNDDVMDLVDANPGMTAQATGQLDWDFSGLQPFESRTIAIRFNLNTPLETPALNGGDLLSFTAIIVAAADDDQADNTTQLMQTVVNSFDPNDKTCLQGYTVGAEIIGEYVNYVIRFENTGTASAVNIFVKDVINTEKFDIASLVPLEGSHPYFTRVNNNKVDFVFENINLPFDDANNDGYVAFKIKTLPTLEVGDTFSNSASIYFDFNHPIVTEPAVTAIDVLKNQDFEFGDSLSVYPNPVGNMLNIQSKDKMELSSLRIYNTLGQLVLTIPNANQIESIDVSRLKAGNYFLNVTSDLGNATMKFIKK